MWRQPRRLKRVSPHPAPMAELCLLCPSLNATTPLYEVHGA